MTFAVQDESNHPTLTPAERQQILRKLKHGPALDRTVLAEYAVKLREDILKKRTNAQA